jgi:subtilisin family serine protease
VLRRTVVPARIEARRCRMVHRLATAVALIGSASAIAAAGAQAQEPVGDYIVTVKPSTSPGALALDVDGERAHFVYRGVLNGFAATLTADEVAQLRSDPDVERIERDGVVQASDVQPDAVWGLDRIDQRQLPLSNSFAYTGAGDGVTAFVIDTGIDPFHSEFEGRAAVAFDAFGEDGIDCEGHGTHVAGTIGSRSYGVAKHVQLRGVRVLDCDGSGTLSSVIAGIDYVRMNHSGPTVANLSLGGGKSKALDTAIKNLVASGVFVAVAAGNENQNACNVSPARAPLAFTTAASSITDRKASFSNWGGKKRNCVDGYAPGVNIVSTVPFEGVEALSGTSMASPHIAGVGVLVLSASPAATPAAVTSTVKQLMTKKVIKGNKKGTPNRLLFMGGL